MFAFKRRLNSPAHKPPHSQVGENTSLPDVQHNSKDTIANISASNQDYGGCFSNRDSTDDLIAINNIDNVCNYSSKAAAEKKLQNPQLQPGGDQREAAGLSWRLH